MWHRLWQLQIEGINFLRTHIPHDDRRISSIHAAPRLPIGHVNLGNILQRNHSLAPVVSNVDAVNFGAVFFGVLEVDVFAVMRQIGIFQLIASRELRPFCGRKIEAQQFMTIYGECDENSVVLRPTRRPQASASGKGG